MWLFRRRAGTPAPSGAEPCASTHARLETAPAPVTRQVASASILPPFLSAIGETESLPFRRVYALYCERAEYLDLEPLSELRLSRELKAAGVLRYRGPRSSSGRRPWLYRVQAAIVFKFPRAADDRRGDA